MESIRSPAQESEWPATYYCPNKLYRAKLGIESFPRSIGKKNIFFVDAKMALIRRSFPPAGRLSRGRFFAPFVLFVFNFARLAVTELMCPQNSYDYLIWLLIIKNR